MSIESTKNRPPGAGSTSTSKVPQDALQFRQTRFAEHIDMMTLTAQGQRGIVRNWSRTGIAFDFHGDTLLTVGAILQGVKISCGEILIYDGSIEIRSVREQEGGRAVYGASFTGDLFLVDGILAAVSVQDFVGTLFSAAKEVESLVPEVCQSLLAVRRALGKLQDFCVETERKWRDLSFDSRCEAERVLMPFLSKKVTELFTYFNMKVANQLDVDTLEAGSVYHRLFAEEAAPEFEAGDFPRRAIAKPRGYAGDYEMMNQLYRGGYEGKDLYGRIISHYVANEAAGASVRFRRNYFLRHLRDELQRTRNSSVLSIACGPAVEIQEFCQEATQPDLDRLKFTLFDLDREALEHAQTKIFEILMKGGKVAKVDFMNASVKAFLSSRLELKSSFDLIYSAGLFDYLDNLTSAALVRHFTRILNPGGRLIIGNFTKANPTKAFCHLILNWNLIHKTEEEISAWGDGLPDCRVELEFDPQRINAFLVVTKDAAD